MQKRKTTRAWRILQKIQTIERAATTSFLKTGSVPKEKLLNRCLKYIEEIQNLPHRTARSKERVLKQAWNIYLKLTELKGPERLDYNATRTVSLETLSEEQIVETRLPNIRTGGLGYAQRRLGASFGIGSTTTKQPWGNQYWQPERAKKARPMKSSDFWFGRKDE